MAVSFSRIFVEYHAGSPRLDGLDRYSFFQSPVCPDSVSPFSSVSRLLPARTPTSMCAVSDQFDVGRPGLYRRASYLLLLSGSIFVSDWSFSFSLFSDPSPLFQFLLFHSGSLEVPGIFLSVAGTNLECFREPFFSPYGVVRFLLPESLFYRNPVGFRENGCIGSSLLDDCFGLGEFLLPSL